jgi:FkbM family methyltransferase
MNPFKRLRNALAGRWQRLQHAQHERANRRRLRSGRPLRVHGQLVECGDVVSPRILEQLVRGSYERQEAESLRRLLLPSDQVLELGSGLGVITSIASRCAAGVLSFEANSRMAELAESNLALNGRRNATVRSGALGPHSGTARFRVARDFWASSLGEVDSDQVQIEVEVHALTDVLEAFKPTVAILDIEGGEYAVLADPAWGACRGLRKVLVELHDTGVDELGGIAEKWDIDRSLEAIRTEFARVGNCTVTLTRKA